MDRSAASRSARYMAYKKDLYTDPAAEYSVHIYKSRSQWLKGRVSGIGGSDASAAIGMNPWRTNLDLWMIKTGRKEAPDISSNERVIYGQNAEEAIRLLYKAKKRGIIDVNYMSNAILSNREHPELLYSPDGLLLERETGRKGILEVKTATPITALQKEKWKQEHIPDNYYIQVLHGMNVTGFDFVDLIAELTYDEHYSQIRIYHIDRDDALDDLNMVKDGVLTFWNEYVKTGREPAMTLPQI